MSQVTKWQLGEWFSWTLTAQVFLTACQAGQIILAARYLDPTDLGLMAVLMVAIGWTQIFQDGGLNQAVIQKQRLSPSQFSTLFWLNIAVALVLLVFVSSAADGVATYFSHQNLAVHVKILAVTLLFTAVGSLYKALFHRDMNFRILEGVSVCSGTLSLLLLALGFRQGMGLWALTLAYLCGSAVSAVLLFIFGAQKYGPPTPVISVRPVLSHYRFGVAQIFERTCNYLASSIDKILVGSTVGIEALGVYNLAWQIAYMPLTKLIPVVSKITFPLLSSIQDNELLSDSYYRRTASLIIVISVSVSMLLAIDAKHYVILAFGSKNTGAAELLPILATCVMVKSLATPGATLLLSRGKYGVSLAWNLLWLVGSYLGLKIALYYEPSAKIACMTLLILAVVFAVIWQLLLQRLLHLSVTFIALRLAEFLMLIFLSIAVAKVLVERLGVASDIFIVGISIASAMVILMAYLGWNWRRLFA